MIFTVFFKNKIFLGTLKHDLNLGTITVLIHLTSLKAAVMETSRSKLLVL